MEMGASEWYNFEECEPFYINLDKGVNLVRFTANKIIQTMIIYCSDVLAIRRNCTIKSSKQKVRTRLRQKNTMQPVRQATTQYAPKTLQKMITQGLAWLI